MLPTVQLPTVATPSPPVVAVAPVTLPPPDPTAKVTVALGTGRLAASRTSTAGGTFTAYPTSAFCASPAWTTTLAGGPIVADVARNRAGLPVMPDPVTVAYRVSIPGLPSSVHPPTVATPVAVVTTVPPVTLPLFRPGVNVTVALGMGLPN